MESYFRSNGKIFEIEHYEKYSKEEAKRVQREETRNEEDYDKPILKGYHSIRGVKIIQEKYSRKAVELSKNEVARLYKFIKEIESKECVTTLNEYYS